jgi:hypothetical protein
MSDRGYAEISYAPENVLHLAVTLLAASIAGKPSGALATGLSAASITLTEVGRSQVAFSLLLADELVRQHSERVRQQITHFENVVREFKADSGIDLTIP